MIVVLRDYKVYHEFCVFAYGNCLADIFCYFCEVGAWPHLFINLVASINRKLYAVKIG